DVRPARARTTSGFSCPARGSTNFRRPRAAGRWARARDGYHPGVSEAFDRLTALVSRLRLDCPWERAQSLDDLQAYLLQETYEVLAAVDAGEAEELREELGDLLFQVFFLAC